MRAMRLTVLASAVSATIVSALPSSRAQIADSNERLPPEVIYFECLAYYVVGNDPTLSCERHRRMEAVRAAKPDSLLPRVQAPHEDFVDFVLLRAAPKAKLAIYRKSRWGKMVAVQGADGKVRLLFDYRGLRDALFTVEVRSGASLPIDKDGGFLSVTVPAGAAEIVISNLSSESKKLPLDTWKLDGSFADRERLLR